MSEKPIVYDIDGYDVITTALLALLNQYPAVGKKEITFNSLYGDNGITVYPTGGAIIQNEKKDITGYTEQKCLYPFVVIYRASGLNEKNRIKIKEWLDNLGRWLERQPVMIDGEEIRLTDYPPLTQNRTIDNIARTSPAYQYGESENKAEEWAIALQVVYINKFERL